MNIIAPSKTKFPRADALAVARELVTALAPRCELERLKVAGSLRRRRAEVGDVEIVYVPKMVEVQDGLFDTVKYAATDPVLLGLVGNDLLRQRENVNGSTMWGAKNKFALHMSSGIPVDFFATAEEHFFMTLVIRTGPKEFNLRLIESAGRQGLKVHAYGVFERMTTGEKIVPQSEREVFELAGLKYLEPWER